MNNENNRDLKINYLRNSETFKLSKRHYISFAIMKIFFSIETWWYWVLMTSRR